MYKTLLYLTIITFIIYFLIFSRHLHSSIDPSLWMYNEELTDSEKLKIQIHSTHHTNDVMHELINNISNGDSWEEAHSKIKPTTIMQHVQHINLEMLELIMNSLILIIGLFLAFILTNIVQLYTPKKKVLAVWYYILVFFLSLPIFAMLIMFLKHYLSFKTHKLY